MKYAAEHGPITVRGLYYQAEVAKLTGIDKTEKSYGKVQRQVLRLRRGGEMRYRDIADLTRVMRKIQTYASPQDALLHTAATYHKDLWDEADSHVEIWIEKNALASVIAPVTRKYGLALAPTIGFASETFCFAAVEDRGNDMRPYYVYYLSDFDRSGHDATAALEEKLRRFAAEKDIPVVFEVLGVTEQQITDLSLSTRDPKRETAADKAWPYKQACELDAIPPDVLRALVEEAIQRHMPPELFDELKAIEQAERLRLHEMVDALTDESPDE